MTKNLKALFSHGIAGFCIPYENLSESDEQMWKCYQARLSPLCSFLCFLILITLQKQVFVWKLKLELRITHHLFFGNNVKAYFFDYDKKKEKRKRRKLILI